MIVGHEIVDRSWTCLICFVSLDWQPIFFPYKTPPPKSYNWFRTWFMFTVMFSFFLLKRSFAALAFNQTWLTIFLLSSTIFVSSYQIDVSCRNYKGNDISGDIQQAIKEVSEMARNGFNAIHHPSESSIHLLQTLFGADRSRYSVVANYFADLSYFAPSEDFIVICGDSTVHLMPPDSDLPKDVLPAGDPVESDPRGFWADRDHGWKMSCDQFSPCDGMRGPDNRQGPEAFTIFARLIYLCPVVLDLPKGRTLAPYKNRPLDGEYIDDYTLVPVVLMHELYHTSIIDLPRKFSSCSRQPINIWLTRDTSDSRRSDCAHISSARNDTKSHTDLSLQS